MAEGIAGISSNNLSISSNLIWTGYAEASVTVDRPKTISIPLNSKYIIIQDFSKNKSCVILKGCSNIIRCNITENGGIAICSLNSTGTQISLEITQDYGNSETFYLQIEAYA